jgi:mannose-1-phosphate guanylyltransferase
MIIPVILSGGSGTRLWPISRKLHPKQFINLVNENTTVFQDTILRLPKASSNPIIICNEEHRFLAAEQLRQINSTHEDIILEPVGKNTAPAIALAALKVINKNLDPLLLVLPTDHIIKDVKAFHKSIEIATSLAEDNKLVTFGVVPKKATTGYGYIETKIDNKAKYLKVKSFKEKPSLEKAQEYSNSGTHLWNSGMFMFKASIYISELKKYAPDILDCCSKSLENEYRDLDFIRLENSEFIKCPEQSIDYAIMEHTKKSIVVPIENNWNDIGTWESLMASKEISKNGNISDGDVTLEDVKNTYVYSTNRLVTALGVSNLIIIDTQDALLVTNKDNTQNIKTLIDTLKNKNRIEVDTHRKVYRPWGYYDLIDRGNEFQVKRILVKPGAKLSLQKHNHRAEHWVVVSGSATIICGRKTYILQKNQSTFIPRGEVHRLENHEKVPLEIIEIQTGDYLGEDDITRLEDDYQRS